MARYYIDTCIWRDYYEERIGPGGRPLGEHATALFMSVIKNHNEIIISDQVIRELHKDYETGKINIMLEMFFRIGALKNVIASAEQTKEARILGLVRDVPPGDALHAIISRDLDCVLVSQDAHFQKLKDITEIRKPEELI